MKSYILFILGMFYGTVLTATFLQLMPIWLMIGIGVAVTIACICVDSK